MICRYCGQKFENYWARFVHEVEKHFTFPVKLGKGDSYKVAMVGSIPAPGTGF